MYGCNCILHIASLSQTYSTFWFFKYAVLRNMHKILSLVAKMELELVIVIQQVNLYLSSHL